MAHEHQAGGDIPAGRDHRKRDPRKELRGTDVLEANMAGVIVVASIALFLSGVVMGVLAVVAREVRREDRAYTLAGAAPSLASRGVRKLNGVARRDTDEYFRPVGELVR